MEGAGHEKFDRTHSLLASPRMVSEWMHSASAFVRMLIGDSSDQFLENLRLVQRWTKNMLNTRLERLGVRSSASSAEEAEAS